MMAGISACETKSRVWDWRRGVGRAEQRTQRCLLMKTREAIGGAKRGALKRDLLYPTQGFL